MDNRKTVQLKVRISAAHKERLVEYAKKNRVTISEIVRAATQAWIDAPKERNDVEQF